MTRENEAHVPTTLPGVPLYESEVLTERESALWKEATRSAMIHMGYTPEQVYEIEAAEHEGGCADDESVCPMHDDIEQLAQVAHIIESSGLLEKAAR